jgi:hypothetical protein
MKCGVAGQIYLDKDKRAAIIKITALCFLEICRLMPDRGW